MSDCVYQRSDGSCEILSAGGEVNEFCVEGPCPDYTPIEYIRKDEFVSKMTVHYCAGCNRRMNKDGKAVYAIGEAPCKSCGIMDMLDEVSDFHAADVRENKWFSVNDTLPPFDQKVLAFVKNKDPKCRFNPDGIYIAELKDKIPVPDPKGEKNVWGIPGYDSEWTVWSWSYFSEPCVTHWMPLPEPPADMRSPDVV